VSLAFGEYLLTILLGLGLVIVATWTRHVFIRQAAPLRVDHYYWLLAANVYREARKLPISFDGRYLLEPRQQSYPPLFGWLLSRLNADTLKSSRSVWLCQAVDATALALGAALGLWFGIGAIGIIALIATVAFAPTLVAYNTQLNPRSFGNLFLIAYFAAQVLATATTGGAAWGWWAIAVGAATAVWLTHKMTTQLMIALWIPFAISLGQPLAWASPALGLLLAAALVGPGAMLYQLIAHVDIVRFWSRYWPYLGVHAIRQSPIYGGNDAERPGAFHLPGIRGLLTHLRLVFGYLPIMALLPLLAILGPPVPAWLMVWTLGTLVWALATALVPPLKGLGAGSLYMFFGAVPAGIWIAIAVESGHPLAFAAIILTTLVSVAALYMGWRQRSRRSPTSDDGFSRLLERLNEMNPERVAVLPLLSVEAIAAGTRHRVLWGAHGYAFDLLTPIFPVVVRPLSETFARYGISRVVWSDTWWPGAEERLAREMKLEAIEAFGSWRMAAVTDLPAPPPVRVCRLVRGGGPGEARAPTTEPGCSERVDMKALAIGDAWLPSFYRQLRALAPDVVDCREVGPAALVVANFAGVPHRLVLPPKTWLERELVAGGLAAAIPAGAEGPTAMEAIYRLCAGGDRPADWAPEPAASQRWT
jgi:hypothetical protein